MGHTPRRAPMKIAPQCLAIVVLASLFLSGVRSDRAADTPKTLAAAVRQLRVGMSIHEASELVSSAGGTCVRIYHNGGSGGIIFHDRKGEVELTLISRWVGTQ